MLGIDTVSGNGAVELSKARLHLAIVGAVSRSFDLHRHFVNDRKVNSDVGVNEGVGGSALENKFKSNRISGSDGTSSG